MPAVCRDIIDLGATGHLCTPFIGVVATQSNVRANGIPIVRLNDPALPHTIPTSEEDPECVPHLGAKVWTASMTVRVNGIGVARTGDFFDFGVMLPASPNVFAG